MSQKAMVYTGALSTSAIDELRRHFEDILAIYKTALLVRADEKGIQALRTEGYEVAVLRDAPVIQINGFEVDTNDPGLSAASGDSAAEPGARQSVVLRLLGPTHPDWAEQLESLGVRLCEKVGPFHFIAHSPAGKVDAIKEMPFVEAVCSYVSAMKLSEQLLEPEVEKNLPTTPGVTRFQRKKEKPKKRKSPRKRGDKKHPPTFARRKGSEDPAKYGNVSLELFSEGNEIAVIDASREAGAKVIRAGGGEVIVYAQPSMLPKLASIPQVMAVNRYSPPKTQLNVATKIIGTGSVANIFDLDGSGQIIAVADSGIDTGVDDNSMSPDFKGRIAGIQDFSDDGASDEDGHGTHVAACALGSGGNSNSKIRGIAPAAELFFQSIGKADVPDLVYPPNQYKDIFQPAYDTGARIQNISWGADDNQGFYILSSRKIDNFAFRHRDFLFCVAAGNDDVMGISNNGAAKNALTVGASESKRHSSDFPQTDADDQDEVADFSSVGPAENDRQKPDVVAPGSWILSARSSVSVADTDGDGVSTHQEAVGYGLPGEPMYGTGSTDTPAAPAGSGPNAKDNYMYASGTSMAAPIVAGAAALVRQYMIEHLGHQPSAALLKALFVAGAVDMGMGVPHNGQGWGRVDLPNTLFPPGSLRVQFADSIDEAIMTAEWRDYEVHVGSTDHPVTVTLVWRDYEGKAIYNSLSLKVTHPSTGKTYTAEPDLQNVRNNVQKIIIDPPDYGPYIIRVMGENVSVGLFDKEGKCQDFAIVVTGATGFSCNPSDVVQVLDRSGSMGSAGYMEPAKERAKQFVDLIQINDRTGLVAFNDKPEEIFPFLPLTDTAGKVGIKNLIDNISSDGMTDLRKAVQKGQQMLGTILGRPRAMIFLSDGKHTVDDPPIDDSFLTSWIQQKQIKVYPIALGPDTDFATLQKLADKSGTDGVYKVYSAADLHKLHEIYYDIVGVLDCGSLVHLESSPLEGPKGLKYTTVIDKTAKAAMFSLSWEKVDAQFDFTLYSADGKTYTPSSPEVYYFEGSTHQFYRVINPAPGRWQMLIQAKPGSQAKEPLVTTAAIVDSEVRCRASVDDALLLHDQLVLRLEVSHGSKPLVGGTAFADVTFPTLTIQELLNKHAGELDAMELDPDLLKGDTADLNLFKLGLVAKLHAVKGDDIWARKTVRVALNDEGHSGDQKTNDGIYAGIFHPKAEGVAGCYEAQFYFEVHNQTMGSFSFRRLVPVSVPEPLII